MAPAAFAAILASLVTLAGGCGGSSPEAVLSFGADAGRADVGSSSHDSGSHSTADAHDSGKGGGGLVVPDGGSPGTPDSGACTPNLTGRLRDFVNKPGFTPASALDDDFENEEADDRGIVETDLGSDLKPVYAHGNNDTATTHGQTQFDWWYRDTAGKNIAYDYSIALTPLDGGAGIQSYDNQEFFPLDGRGWNDEYTADDGNLHNFSFTFELHTTFEYQGGETFTFIGDDDVFVFVSNKLVVDLGGVHSAETKSISLDTLVTDDPSATPVPLTLKATYPLDIFYNERHTVSSHFRMDTSIAFNNCSPIIAPQ